LRIKLTLSTYAVAAGLFLACSTLESAAAATRGLVTHAAPIYPDLARKMHVGGVVVIHVTIQPNGVVSDTKVESGHPLLVAAAQEAVRHWRYSPSTDVSEITVEVKFNIDGH
jgi:TonB family protein